MPLTNVLADRRFLAFMAGVQNLILHIDGKGNILRCKPEYFLENYFTEDFSENPGIFTLFGVQTGVLLSEAVEKAITEGFVSFPLANPEEGLPDFSVSITAIRDREALMAVSRIPKVSDEPERKRFESSRFRRIIENLDEVIYELDADGIITYISPAVEKLTGIPAADLINMPASRLSGRDQKHLRERMNILKSRESLIGEYKYNKAGEEIWIGFSTRALFRDGEFIGGVGTLMDITGKKHDEIDLRRSREKFRLLAENMSDVIWIFNPGKRKYHYISPKVTDLIGYTAEEVQDSDTELLVSPDELNIEKQVFDDHLKRFVRNPGDRMFTRKELQITHKNGRKFWAEVTAWFNLDCNGEVELYGITRNIEDRKQSELWLQKFARELEVSESKFSQVFNLVPVIQAICDATTGEVIDVNQQLVNTMGYSRDEMLGRRMPDRELVPDEAAGRRLAKIILTGEEIKDFEVTARKRNGEPVDLLFSLSRISPLNADYLVVTAVDITAIKRKERHIRRLHAQQRLLAGISAMFNEPGEPTEKIDTVLRMLGLHTGVSRVYLWKPGEQHKPAVWWKEWVRPGSEALGAGISDRTNPSVSEWNSLLSEQGMILTSRTSELSGDLHELLKRQLVKSVFAVSLSSSGMNHGFLGFDECRNIREWTPEVQHLLLTVSNIVSDAFERREAIQKLEDSRMRLNLAIQSAREGLWDLNVRTGELYYSEMSSEMLGLDPSETNPHIRGWETRVLEDDRPRTLALFEQHLRGETEYYEAVYRIRTCDGRLKWLLDHGKVVERDENNQALRVIGMNIDITEQKENEIRLKESLETLQKLFSIIAHDLRAPLSSFQMALELITSGAVTDGVMRDQLLTDLESASRINLALLENLLQWSRSQTNTIRLKPETLNVIDLIDENIGLAAPSAAQKSIEIRKRGSSSISAFCDRESVNLVIRNLISNAIKFTPDNGSITLAAEEMNGMVHLSVEDTGVGMEPVVMDKLFQSSGFHSTYGTRNEKGSGLGLRLCRDFAERNGGELRAESRPGEGSRFILTLPLA